MVVKPSGSPSTDSPIAYWDRLPGEKALWYARFLIYLGLEHRRSLHSAVMREWEMEKAKQGDGYTRNKPTGTPGAWRDAAARWDWEGRASAFYDDLSKKAKEGLRLAWEKLAVSAPDAAAVLIELLASEDDEQRRLAAVALLHRLFVLYGRGDEVGAPPPITIVEYA